MNITVNRIKDVISGTIGSTKYNVPFSQEVYDQLLDLESELETATTQEQVKDLVAKATDVTSRKKISDAITEVCPYIVFNKDKNEYYVTQNNVVSSIAIPQVLVDRIIQAHEEKTPIEPFVKAWIWFLRNKNFTPAKARLFAKYITTTVVDQEEYAKLIEEGYSEEVAKKLSTYNDVSITKNGQLSTYKYVSVKNWKYGQDGAVVDRYTKTVDEETGKVTEQFPEIAEDWYLIPPVMGERGELCSVDGEDKPTARVKIGAVHSLPSWSSVNCSDYDSYVKGLHLGGLQYIKGYGGKTELLLNCFVNPMHIGAFDHSGNGAVRCLEYFVHSANFAPNKNIYHESDYAKRSEEKWDSLRTEAIQNSEDIIAKLKSKQSELRAF